MKAISVLHKLGQSLWLDNVTRELLPGHLSNRLGIAIAERTYTAYQELLASARFQRAANAGARARRLLWASTGTKDPTASDVLYVRALAAPFATNTMPEAALRAFEDHGEAGEMLAGWRRMRAGTRQLHRGPYRYRRGRDPAAGRGRGIVCEVMERSLGLHRIEERDDSQGELTS